MKNYKKFLKQTQNILAWEAHQRSMYRSQGIIIGAVGVGVVYFLLVYLFG